MGDPSGEVVEGQLRISVAATRGDGESFRRVIARARTLSTPHSPARSPSIPIPLLCRLSRPAIDTSPSSSQNIPIPLIKFIKLSSPPSRHHRHFQSPNQPSHVERTCPPRTSGGRTRARLRWKSPISQDRVSLWSDDSWLTAIVAGWTRRTANVGAEGSRGDFGK